MHNIDIVITLFAAVVVYAVFDYAKWSRKIAKRRADRLAQRSSQTGFMR